MNFEEYASGLKQRWCRRSEGLVVLRNPGSTHHLARQVVADYARESDQAPPLDLIAWEQSAGTGRQQRPWRSPPGQGIYVTLVRSREVQIPPQLLPLAVALALAEPLRKIGGLECRLKWPNDLFVGTRKLGGILIDLIGEVAVLSFGINYGGALSHFCEPRATSLEEEGLAPPGLDFLAAELIMAVDEALVTGDVSGLVERYRAWSLHRPGDQLVCRVGKKKVQGIFRGFDSRGFLRLEVEGTEKVLAAGELESEG